jgi:hypothetical protein
MVWFLRHRRVVLSSAVAVLSIPAFLAWETRHAIRQARDRAESSGQPVPAKGATEVQQAALRAQCSSERSRIRSTAHCPPSDLRWAFSPS